MILALFVMIGIMVLDRILYSSYAFTSRLETSKRLGLDAPLTLSDPSNFSDDKSTNSS